MSIKVLMTAFALLLTPLLSSKQGYSSSTNQRDEAKFLHQTCKPVDLIKRHSLHTTNKGNIVGDFFCGSVSTCVACIDIERHYHAFDNNPQWVEVANNRTKGVDANGVQSLWTLGVYVSRQYYVTT